MNNKRRRLIKAIFLSSATLNPVIKAFAREFDISEDSLSALLEKRFNNLQQFKIVDTNLLNLHYYFINTKKKGGNLIPQDATKKSFLIIRLTQQHISEKGYWQEDIKKNPTAHLSGFSYLAFEIWPDKTDDSKPFKKKLKFDIQNFLDWNLPELKLITILEWLELKNAAVLNTVDCKSVDEKKNFKSADLPPSYGTEKLLSTKVLIKYQAIVDKLLKQNVTSSTTDFVPITFFEIPNKLFISPLIRFEKGTESIKAGFWINRLANKNDFKKAVRKYEVWNNTLTFKKQSHSKTSKAPDTDKEFVIEKPHFRAIGFHSEQPLELSCNDPVINCNAPVSTDGNILPTLLDKEELSYLTQYANGISNTDFKKTDFDIRELNGFFITGLGVITHLKYYNVDEKPANVDLIEYEHIITQGRDIFIKVARMGYNCKTGQRYKHVIEGKRKIDVVKVLRDGVEYQEPVSFVELKQYCECIEKSIDFLQNERDNYWTPGLFIKLPNLPLAREFTKPAKDQDPHFRRHLFTKLSVEEPDRIPIDCLTTFVRPQIVSELQCLPWFWPVRENLYTRNTRDTSVAVKDYLHFEYEGIDWEGNAYRETAPFMFIRASVLENGHDAQGNAQGDLKTAYENYFSDADLKFTERRLKKFQGQKIAYGPPAIPAAENNTDPSDSRPHVLETESVDVSFKVRKVPTGTPAQKVPGVLVPQTLRTNVFLDHIRDITLKKISSVVEYHTDYIKYKYDEYEKRGNEVLGNGVKFLLNLTKAYKDNNEESHKKTFILLSQAIRESKNQLGNIAVPDIIPETVSLDKHGITLPQDLKRAIRDKKVYLNTETGIAKLNSFGLAEIAKKFSEFLGGIDMLKVLLQQVPANDLQKATPLMELQKFLNKLEETTKASEVYKEIINFTVTDPIDGEQLTPAALIEKYKRKINDAIGILSALEADLKSKLAILSNTIPNSDELNALVKHLFEQLRTQAFEMLMDAVHFGEVKALIDNKTELIKAFVADEIHLLMTELEKAKEELTSFVTEIQDDLRVIGPEILPFLKFQTLVNQTNAIIGSVSTQYNQFLTGNGLKVFHDNVYAQLLATKAEASSALRIRFEGVDHNVFYDTRSFKLETNIVGSVPFKKPFTLLSSIDRIGAIQLGKKVEDLVLFIEVNRNGSALQKAIVEELRRTFKTYSDALQPLNRAVRKFTEEDLKLMKEKVEKWQDDFNEELKEQETKLTAILRERLMKIYAVVEKLNPYIDQLRLVDPYFYYTEQVRLLKEINDTKRRFHESLRNADDLLKRFEELVHSKVKEEVDKYKSAVETFRSNNNLAQFVNSKETIHRIVDIVGENALKELIANPAYTEARRIFDRVSNLSETIKTQKEVVDTIIKDSYKIIQTSASFLKKSFDERIRDFINKLEQELSEATGTDRATILKKIQEARNIYKLLTSVKQQDLKYTWKTNHFRDANLGIITFKKFSNPDTELIVDVNTSIKFAAGKFPPVVEKVDVYTENRLKNFGVGFFSMLNIGFTEVNFISGTNVASKFEVKIKDVKFEGALAFVQKFESYLKTLGKGLILQLNPDHFKLGYSLPIPAIETPGFSFFNLSLNFDFRLFFDKRPMRFGFSLASPESKFTIAAGIYAGFGYFSLVGEPRRGIVEINAALEAGAWAGLRLGPVHGEVKLAFGFHYTRNEFGVRLEGYIVAEGRLTVWFLEVSARIYLGIISENSVASGMCTVSYSVKIGFFERSFTGTYKKQIAGAKSNNRDSSTKSIYMLRSLYFGNRSLTIGSFENSPEYIQFAKTQANADSEIYETYCVTKQDWELYFLAL